VERELKKEEHFKRYIGSKVNVRLFSAVNGKRGFTGVLLAHGDGYITVRPDSADTEEAIRLDKTKVASVRLYDDYDIGGLD
jgi:ribosome maturation factor RimP